MATFSCSISSPFAPKKLNPNKIQSPKTQFPNIQTKPRFQNFKIQCTNPSRATAAAELDELSMGIDNLHRFIQINLGTWVGSFHQFDDHGKLLQKVTTKLSAGSYGEDQLISLIQTLYIKQPTSTTSISGHEEKEEWAEYKIKESNMFTVDKYQQLGFFPTKKAFVLRYQTAGMLDTVLRQGVLGEDDIGEESPRNLKLPSNRPSLVCESCLYSIKGDMRARAFHIMAPKGVVDMLLVFLEEKGGRTDAHLSLSDAEILQDDSNRVLPFLGRWKGQSVTTRSGVYGATLAEHDTVALLEIDANGQLIQETTTKTGDITSYVKWSGTVCDDLITFDKGFQLTLLPGGMYMGYPSDVSKSVAETKSFHLEFCWLESSNKRQRLIRTYDHEGLAVSSTYFFETRE